VADAALRPLVRRQAGDVVAPEADAAGAHRQEAGDALDDRGAPGAVASDQRHDLVLADGERHPAQDVGGTAEGIDIDDFEQHAFVPCVQADSGAPSRMLATSLFARIWSGVPSARKAPSCIITMRSE